MAFDENFTRNPTCFLSRLFFLIALKPAKGVRKELIGIGNVLTVVFVLLLIPYADSLVQAILTAG